MAIQENDQVLTEPVRRAVTMRAIGIGALCSGFLAWGGHYTRHIGHTTKMAQDHLPWGAVVPFLLIAVVLNKVLEKVRPEWVLRPSELLVIFSMALVASALPSYFMGHLIANVAAPHYFDNTENRWAEDLHPYLPEWAVVTDRTTARWFFEGRPVGAEIPWGPWAVPMVWRLSLVFMVAVFGFCAVSILRKQWVEHERLTFPLMTLPLEMSKWEPRGFWPVGIMNRPVFWWGFALASFTIYWNIISYFEPMFPVIPDEFPLLEFGRDFPPIHMRLYPLIMGVTYFMELDISFSILVFHLLLTFEMGMFNRFGIEIGPTHIWPSSEFENWQGFGAICVLVPWSLWMAREHLMQVFRKAVYNVDDVDDSGELLSYRAAVLGVCASGLFILGWCVASGMSVFVAVVFFAMVFVVWLGITRVCVEGGMTSSRMIQGQFVTYRLLGVANMAPRELAAFALTETWHHDIKTILLANLSNSARLYDGFRHERRRLVGALGLSLFIVITGSAYYQISSSYDTGAFNYGGIYGPYVQGTYDTIAGYIRDPYSLKRERIFIALIGMVTTG
ncbi:MAG: hypothetical protein QGG64_13605, partial [Candidatus Latescibacteria bacterium]|nr:hypothetical protein [Candidatus Latescibacterota bacterium]